MASFQFVGEAFFVACWDTVGWPTVAVVVALTQSFLYKSQPRGADDEHSVCDRAPPATTHPPPPTTRARPPVSP